MPDAQRKQNQQESDLGMTGFENLFDNQPVVSEPTESTNMDNKVDATASGDSFLNGQLAVLIEKMTQLLTFNVDQRVETARISNQLIENQRQLVATQQILIRLMERSIELTRHITTIEEKLPAIFELPSTVEQLREKVAHLENVELR
jgi:hypothetical protein